MPAGHGPASGMSQAGLGQFMPGPSQAIWSGFWPGLRFRKPKPGREAITKYVTTLPPCAKHWAAQPLGQYSVAWPLSHLATHHTTYCIYKDAHHYPVWASLARDYFLIMVSSVSSKQAFSQGGITISKCHSSLIVEALQCLKCALHQDLLFCEAAPSITPWGR